MKILVAVLLIVHGLIVIAQSSSSFTPGAGIQNPSWLAWWPANLGQSWLLNSLGIEKTLFARAGGLLWLAGGIALAAAGLSVLGFMVPTALWHSLALFGAAVSLVILGVFLHPFYIVGIASSVVLLVALLWEQLPILERLGL